LHNAIVRLFLEPRIAGKNGRAGKRIVCLVGYPFIIISTLRVFYPVFPSFLLSILVQNNVMG